MQRQKSEPIDRLLDMWLRESGMETPYYQHRLIEAWPSTVGPMIARLTTSLSIRNQTLCVSIRSSAARAELMMERRNLVARLNEAAGAYTICDIEIR